MCDGYDGAVRKVGADEGLDEGSGGSVEALGGRGGQFWGLWGGGMVGD